MLSHNFEKWRNHESKLKEEKLSGFQLAFRLIKLSHLATISHEMLIGIIVSLIRAFIPTIYKEIVGITVFGMGRSNDYMVISLIFLNFYYFWMNYSILIKNITDIISQKFLLTQLTSLLTTEKKFWEDFPLQNSTEIHKSFGEVGGG